jgi:crotonobetainyl-CoA:carnitine CoA-transferase CaiB-like acyl-CoA transferase
VRALDLTRILAGPVGGRALAAYGADVMLVNSPHLPNIEAIADTSRGKLSTHIDLRTDAGREALENLLGQAHVFVQGYRPGGLAALGFGPQEAARQRPGLVYVSLSAYGAQGPWAARRGFDSLVQTATGFNHAEGEAAGQGKPRPLPMQLLDHATGYLIAMGASAALGRQQREGGSWHVQVSLAQTAHWLRGLGRIENGFGIKRPDAKPYLQNSPSGFGELMAMQHSAQLSRTPAQWTRPAVPPGTHAPVWP